MFKSFLMLDEYFVISISKYFILKCLSLEFIVVVPGFAIWCVYGCHHFYCNTAEVLQHCWNTVKHQI